MPTLLEELQPILLGAGILSLSMIATMYVKGLGFFCTSKAWQVTIIVMHCSPLLLNYASSEYPEGNLGWNPFPPAWIAISWLLRGGTSASGLSRYSFGLAAVQVATLAFLQVEARRCTATLMAFNAVVAIGFWAFTLASATGLLTVSFHPIDKHMKLGVGHMVRDGKARVHFYREALLHGLLQAFNLAMHVGSSSKLQVSWTDDILTLRTVKDFAYALALWVWVWTAVVGACPYPAIKSFPCHVLAFVLPALASLHDYVGQREIVA